MYLHFHIEHSNAREYFPSELGILTNKINVKSKISYYLNGMSIFDDSKDKGYINESQYINFFVGSNNSGKSRFLRSLFKMSFYVSDNEESPLDIKNSINENQLTKNANLPFNTDIEDELKKYWNTLDHIIINPFYVPKAKETLSELKSTYEHKELIDRLGSKNNTATIQECINIIDRISVFLDKIEYHDLNVGIHKMYIPVLRSLVTDQGFSTDTFNNIVKSKFKLGEDVFTGLNLYNEVSELHTSAEIEILDSFSDWIKNNFYKDSKVRIVPDRKTTSVLLQIDGKLRAIHDLGDGIQQLLLMMFPIFTAKERTWFYIEEPETHLHPGLQRIFVETLLNDKYIKNKKLKFFFTTHSNHFLDLSIDYQEISIFQFEKENDEKFNIRNNVKPSKEILDLLGVNSSSVFLANASIWVEGPTDRKYISKWVKLYCEHKQLPYLREDIDFAFFEYGGNLIEHYLFDEDFDEDVNESQVRDKIKAFAHSNKIYLLADNDNAKDGSAKATRRNRLEEISSRYFHYQNTLYREIENLLPASIIKDFLAELSNEPDANLNVIDFKQEEYYQIGLGHFLYKAFKSANIKSKKFKAKSGTLNNMYKNRLCDFVVNKDYKYSDLIEDNTHLDKIITNLYSFITSK